MIKTHLVWVATEFSDVVLDEDQGLALIKDSGVEVLRRHIRACKLQRRSHASSRCQRRSYSQIQTFPGDNYYVIWVSGVSVQMFRCQAHTETKTIGLPMATLRLMMPVG